MATTTATSNSTRRSISSSGCWSSGVIVEALVIPDDIHDFLLLRTWQKVTAATGEFFEKQFLRPRSSVLSRRHPIHTKSAQGQP